MSEEEDPVVVLLVAAEVRGGEEGQATAGRHPEGE